MCHVTTISSVAGNLAQQSLEQQIELLVTEVHTLIPYKLFQICLEFLLPNRFNFVLQAKCCLCPILPLIPCCLKDQLISPGAHWLHVQSGDFGVISSEMPPFPEI